MSNAEQHQALLMSDDDDEGLGFGEVEADAKNRLKHPVVALFHILFRSAAILVYMFGWLFFSGYITTFVTVLILLSLDFWTVKNITGRILVGLRWWNQVDEEGTSHWVFESKKGTRAGGRAPERKVFWTGLIAAPVVWVLLFFSSFFTLRFQWTILTVIALALNGANLYGYIRCKLGHKPGMADLQPGMAGILQQGISKFVFQPTGGATPAEAPNAFQQRPTVQSV